ncbi:MULTISPECIES: hypothetical protein [Corallococcus]|uniref:hypothetical protein n=1 Tax=Corallococcus TaxID=83461 RepID=UPI0011C46AB5|nr:MULTISPECIES: hypothetical protein [Corallococcus]
MTTVASVVVGREGFRVPEAQSERLIFAEQIANHCRRGGADVVLLPAGYLFSQHDEEKALTRDAKALALACKGVSLVAGVDSGTARKLGQSKVGSGKRLDEWTKKRSLPFWVFASAPDGTILRMFRQRSTTAANGAQLDAPSKSEQQERTVELAGLNCYLLACGELFNPHLRASLESKNIDLITHLAHKGLGRTFPKTFPRLATTARAWVINSQHALNGFCWAAKRGSTQADYVPGALIRADASAAGEWAQISFWNVA